MLNAAMQNSNLSEAERVAIQAQAQTRGLGAALGLLGGLVTAAAERARKQEERAEQVAQLKADVAKSGKIGASLDAAKEYIVQKEQEADTQAAWIEKQEAANAAMLQDMSAAQETAVESAPDWRAGLQALYEGRKAGEAQFENAVCTPENIQKPKNLLGKGRLWLEEIAGRIAPGLNLANKLSPLEFRERVDGRFSVAVNQELALKKSGEYLDDIAQKGFEFNPAGGYRPSTLLGKTTKGTLKAAVPGGLDMLTTGLFNAYDYTFGEKKGETDKLQKWAVSTGVDLGGSLLTGVLAAGAVGGSILLAGYILGAPVTVPATLIVGATVVTGVIFDIGLELSGAKEPIKVWANQQWDKAEPVVSDWLDSIAKGLSNNLNEPALHPAQSPIPAPTAPDPLSTQMATPPAPPANALNVTPSVPQKVSNLPPDTAIPNSTPGR
mgnify:CR=1 FL=1